MSATEEQDRWVQCSKCQKWRMIPDETVFKVTEGPWECRLNVFSAEFNHCGAPQEKMPVTSEAEVSPLTANGIISGLGLEMAETDGDSLFSVSTCTCSTCKEMNAAVREWVTIAREPHVVPIIQCAINSISATTSIAENLEREKRFLWCPDKPEIPSA